MRIAFEVILVTAFFGGFFGELIFALPVAEHFFTKGLDRTVGEMYNSYITISNDRADNTNEVDVISRVLQVYNNPSPSVESVNPQKTKTAYLVVRTTRHRNKRSISYLTLCHFKICNMGRKRGTRYFHTIRRHDGNES